MKIQSISATNFKGLFTDKSKENNGKWKVIYSPYSWELAPYKDTDMLDVKKSNMDPKKPIEIISDLLPNNEEIFIPQKGDSPAMSKDINGTVSYYAYPKHIKNGETQSDIEIGPALDREESLKVYRKKLNKFRELKLARQEEIARELYGTYSVQNPYSQFRINSKKYDDSFFGKEYKLKMDEYASQMYKASEDNLAKANEYIAINKSLDNIDKIKARISKELKMIKEAKMSGNLVDISRRDVVDPNKPLWDAIKEIVENNKLYESTKKILVFPSWSVPLKNYIDNCFDWGLYKYKPYTAKDFEDLLKSVTFFADHSIGKRGHFI